MNRIHYSTILMKIGIMFVIFCLLMLGIESIPYVQAAKGLDTPIQHNNLGLFNDLVPAIQMAGMPIYQWHTFLGSHSAAIAMVLDKFGNIYLTGESNSTWNGPGGVAPLNPYTGNCEIFVMKLSRNGEYQWHTFLGSINYDGTYGMAVDDNGNLYLAGYSEGAWSGPGNVPPIHAYSHADLVVIKLSSNGAYNWHTFYGDAGADLAQDIVLDKIGNIYVVGCSTGGWNGPNGMTALNPYTGNDGDIFVLKLSSAGAYQWHTFYGSTNYDEGNGIALDQNGNIYLTGESTWTWNGPADRVPLNPHSEGPDMVVIKLDGEGKYLWHTFYPSKGSGITVNDDGSIYVIGSSYVSWNGPGNVAPRNSYTGGLDILVLKLTTFGNYQWHAFYGSPAYDMGVEIAEAANGRLFLTAISDGAWNGPGNTQPLNPYSGYWDITLLKLSSSGDYQSHMFYGSYTDDAGIGIALDHLGNIYMAGYSYGDWTGPGGDPPLNPFNDYQNVMVMKLFDETISYPFVTSITHLEPTPSNASSVTFRVVFSEAVTGMDTSFPFSDLVLTTEGVTGASIVSVNGSEATYTVTVNTGSGNGAIRLDVIDDDSIYDSANNTLGGLGIGNGNFTSGEIYTINKSVTLPMNWVGGVSVASDKKVVSVGRPHIGAEVASYGGFAQGSLTSYVPMLFRKAYGTYNSALYVQNVSGSLATLTVKYYDSEGNLKCTKNDTVAALSSKGYWLPTGTCNSGSLDDGFVGGAVVTSNQPIVTVGRPHVGDEIMTYDGFSGGSLTSYIPMLFKGAYGGLYNSAFYIQNVNAGSDATIQIKYYDSEGILKCTRNDTIKPLASKGYWVPSATCDTGTLPAEWVGGVVVTSNQPIVGIGRPHIGTQVTTYNGFTGGGSSSYIPMLFKGAYGETYNAAFYLQNTSPSIQATVSIKYYDNAGALKCTKTDTIKPLASVGYWVPTATCDTGSLPAEWVGGVVVTSTQPVVGVGRPHIGGQVTTYNGFTKGSLSTYLPMLFKDAFGGSYNSAFYVQNTDSTDATITVKFYDTDGNLTCSRQDTMAALSTLGYWIPSVTCNP